MHTVSGSCHCGNVRVELEIARECSTYQPRACDCDFCRKHDAAWVSDPQGSLAIRIRDEGNIGFYRQGSGLAECLFCRNCGVLVAVIYREAGRVYGAINAKAVEGGAIFGAEQTSSPKTLTDNQKTKRWQDLWFSGVTIEIADPQR
jgi:hypothetical protein